MPSSPKAAGSRALFARVTRPASVRYCRHRSVRISPARSICAADEKSEAMSDPRLVTSSVGSEACLAGYLPDPRRYDELLDEHGTVRAHWRPLVEGLTAGKAHDTARRALELTRRLIVENGVAYNVYSDPQGADRPWVLDPLPLILSQDEWRKIEKGVAQRACV